MVQPPIREPLEKITHLENGGLFILCNNNSYAGMYPASLSDVLNCSLEKANFIIDVLAEIAATHDFETQDDATDFVFSLSQVIPDPPNGDDRYDYIQNAQSFLTEPLISIDDVAEILEVTVEFAKKIYESFKKPLDSEQALDEFIIYIDRYLKSHYKDGIPEIYKNVKIIDIPNPPLTELSSDAVDNHGMQNITHSAHFALACHTVASLLDISLDEATLLLSSPQSLANFLEHDNITDIDLILKEIEQGNLDLLVNVMQAKIDALMQNITQDTLETSLNDFDIQDESIQNNDLNEQEDNLEEFVEPRQEEDEQEDFEEFVPEIEIETEAGAEKSNIPDDISQIPLTELPKARPVASIVEIEPVEQVSSDNKSSSTSDKEPDTLPDNLPDMLRYVLKLKERITAKSLSESFKIFGVDISQALARFIIEEGRYGGEAPNNNRITQMSMVEKLIDDIEKESDLKSFVKIYLTKVNDDLKSMIAGGGGG